MVSLYSAVFDAVGSRAPCRDRIWTKVISHWSGIAAGMVDGTVKYSEYWPQ